MKNRIHLLFLAAALLIVPSALAQRDHDHPDRPDRTPATQPSASPGPSVSAQDHSDNQKVGNPLGLGGKNGQSNVDQLDKITEQIDSQRNSGGTPHDKPDGKSGQGSDKSSDKSEHQTHERTEHPDHK